MSHLTKAMTDLDAMRAGAALVVRESRGRDPLWQGGAGSVNAFGAAADFMRAREHYEEFQGWVYAAIGAIARRIAEQPVVVERFKGKPTPRRAKSIAADDDWQDVGAHPFLDALANPNELMTQWSLTYVTAVSLELVGRALLWLTPDGQVWPVPLHWCRVESDAERVFARYIVTPDGSSQAITIDADRMLHFHYPHPADPRRAWSPYFAACKTVAVDNSILDSQLMVFENGISPSAVITLGDPSNPANMDARPLMDSAGHQQLIETLRSRYAGLLRRGEPFIVDALCRDIKPWSLTPEELDFGASTPQTKSRILQIFGVNPILLGEIEGANRASALVAEQHFVANTINPKLRLMSEVLTGWAGPIYAPGERLRFRILPAEVADPENARANISTLAGIGAITLNEARAELGWPPVPGGDVAMAPFNLTPAPIGELPDPAADGGDVQPDTAYTSGD